MPKSALGPDRWLATDRYANEHPEAGLPNNHLPILVVRQAIRVRQASTIVLC